MVTALRDSVLKNSKSAPARGKKVLLPARHFRHFFFTQIATDAALRPKAVCKNFPASRTLPIREPPSAGKVNADPQQ